MKAVLLDLDDTLLDYSGGAEQCWAQACAGRRERARPGGCCSPSSERSAAGSGAIPSVTGASASTCCERGPRSSPTRSSGAAPPTRAAPRRWPRTFAARRRAVMTLFPEAHDVLRALAGPRAAAGAGHQWRRARAARQDRASRAGAVLRRDPDRRARWASASRRPSSTGGRWMPSACQAGPEVWMVGDHLEFDVAGSQRAGLRAAWIDRPGAGLPPGSAAQPDRILRTLDQLTRATVAP